MPISYNLEAVARVLFDSTRRKHVVLVGDSQMSGSRWYFGDWAFQKAMPCSIPVVGAVLETYPTGSIVKSYGSLTGTGGTITRSVYGFNDTDNTIGAPNSTGYCICPMTAHTFSADQAANQALGNGITLNRRADTAGVPAGFDWRLGGSSGRAWFTDASLEAKMVSFDCGTAAAMPWRFLLRRTPSVTTSTAYVNLTPPGTLGFYSSSWTATLAGAGNTDEELRLVPECNSGDESIANAHITYVRGVVRKPAVGGILPPGVVLDTIGRSSTSASESLSTGGSQAALQSYFSNTIDCNDIVVFSMYGHNMEVAEITTVPNATWQSNVETRNLRIVNAIRAAFPSANIHVIAVLPWMYTAAANGIDSVADAEAAEALLLAAAQRNNWAMFSFYSATNGAPIAANNLHLTDGSAQMQYPLVAASLLWQELSSAAASSVLRASRARIR